MTIPSRDYGTTRQQIRRQVVLHGFACLIVATALAAWIAPWGQPMPLAFLEGPIRILLFGVLAAPLMYALLRRSARRRIRIAGDRVYQLIEDRVVSEAPIAGLERVIVSRRFQVATLHFAGGQVFRLSAASLRERQRLAVDLCKATRRPLRIEQGWSQRHFARVPEAVL